MLVTGLVLVASSAVTTRLDWPRLAVGSWLLAVACGGAWAGPVNNLAVCALAAAAPRCSRRRAAGAAAARAWCYQA